jgi:Na+-transporting NADH:ubiquinone oxidoreductase subunit NqrF
VASVHFGGRSYALLDGENILDGLLRQGVQLSYSCKAGVCGSCVMKATTGSLPAKSQAGLKDSWKARGYFLACSCVPEGDLELAAPGDDLRFGATIRALTKLSDDVIQARLAPDTNIDFRAGQYVTILRQDGLARSYSIASLPEEGELELHIRKIPNGMMSGWFHDAARPGDRVTIIGPSGECFYVSGREDQPMLLAGTGTGLSPLYGIVRDSIARRHRGRFTCSTARCTREVSISSMNCATWRRSILPCATSHRCLEARKATALLSAHWIESSRNAFRVWPAGVDSCAAIQVSVQSLKLKLFLAGMASRDIYADAFIPAAAPPACS